MMRLLAALRPLVLLLVAFLLPACSRTDVVRVPADGLDDTVASLLDRLVAEAESRPRDGAARGRLGMAYEANRLNAAARLTYAQAQSLAPGEPRWWYHPAVQYAVGGDLVRASARIDSALTRDDTYAPAWWRRGNWRLALGDDAEAERSFARVRELKPNHPSGRIGMARVYLHRGEPERAERLLLDAIEIRPHGHFVPYLHQLLGTVYRQTGRLEEARAALARADASRPDWQDPWRQELDEYRVALTEVLFDIRLRLEVRSDPAIVAELEGLREKHPTNATVLTYLGVALQGTGQADRAAQILERAVELHPDHGLAWENLVVVRESRGDLTGALAASEQAIAVSPNRASAHSRRAALLLRAGRMRDALAAWESALERDPAYRPALEGAAGLLGATGRWPEAAAYRDRLAGLSPDNPDARFAAALAWLAAGDTTRADEHTERAARLAPDDPRLADLRSRR